jgi:hypothetical protein
MVGGVSPLRSIVVAALLLTPLANDNVGPAMS